MAQNKSTECVQPKDATAPYRRIDVQMVQNVLLVWLDENVDENSSNCRNTIIQLRETVNNINIFTDNDECVDFLSDMKNDKTCMIISGSLGPYVVPCIHDLVQLNNIFILCSNKNYHEQWSKSWSKIKGVFTEITHICEALKTAVKQCEQDAIPISFVATNGEISNKKLNQLEPSYMYTQIMKEIFLTIKFEPKHIQEYINHCRNAFANNERELNKINKFEHEYCDRTCIWWYTYECFLYPMLNRALRLLDVDIIVKMGFFITDLHRRIAQLHQEQVGGDNSNNIFNVYRGQGMLITEFEKLQQTKGGLLSFNNFLSTSKKHNVSLRFAQRGSINSNMVGILFVMTVNPAQSTTPFASVIDVGAYGDSEDEVLFAMHSIFRIQDIQPMGDNHRLFQVELILTSDNDKDLQVLTDRLREEIPLHVEGWYRLGFILWKMGQPEKAQQVYETLLKLETKETGKAAIYHLLGMMKSQQGDDQEAIAFYEKSIAIEQKITPLRHANLARFHNNIGVGYRNMGEYSKALSFQKQALAIRQQLLSPNHPDLVGSYNNIGLIYYEMGEYPKALAFQKQALAIRQQLLPPNHPDLATSYDNIGLMYYEMSEYPKALSFQKQALAIRQQSLPPNHPDLAASYNNIGNVYYKMGEYSKALSSQKQALTIRQQSLPPSHPDLAASYINIGNLYYEMSEYPKALSSHEKALAIQQQSLPPSHPELAASYNNIGSVYLSRGEYSKARSLFEKAVTIGEQSLPANHPRLKIYKDNLDIEKKKL